MVLLDMLYQEKHDIVIAHVNYQKREDSYLDEKVVKEYICEKKIIFEKLLIDKNQYTDDNFQKQARDMRYQFFVELAHKYNTDKVYVAHHRDDYLETYLFQKQRQGLYDYYGIKEESSYKDITIIRPLLKYYKRDLEKYALENNIPFHEDYSNKQLVYTRNIIRDELKNISNEEKEELIKQSQIENKIISQEKKVIEPYLNVKKMDEAIFMTFNQDMKRRWLYSIIKKYDITIKHLDDIIKKISTTNSFKVTFLDTTIIKSYGIIYVLNDVLKNYCYSINTEDDFKECYCFFKENYNYEIRKPKVNYPYLIRNYSKDDFIDLDEDYQKFRKRIKRDKVPFFLRDYLPIVVKENKVRELI